MKKYSILLLISFLRAITLDAQDNIGIGTNNPNASAKLDVSSTTQGMLIPRMTSAQRNAIVSPATGLMVYQTDGSSGFYYYNGTAWSTFGSPGATGPQGPQGPSGSLGIYGDGSAGNLTVSSVLDLTNPSNISLLPNGLNLQFSNINILPGATLIVPSGITLKCTGNVNIAGNIVVSTGTADNGSFRPHSGVGSSSASTIFGGVGLTNLQISSILSIPSYGGGAGARSSAATGGEGGGSFAIYAQGSMTVSGNISANGANGVNPGTPLQGIVGAGGGAGGVIVLVGKSSLSVSGTINAKGGNGSNGADGNGGNSEGGAGGGGGGIIALLSSSTPSVSGTTSVTGGTAGANAGASATINSGGGGGACGGNGGGGGSTTTTSSSGNSGWVQSIVCPEPEKLIIK